MTSRAIFSTASFLLLATGLLTGCGMGAPNSTAAAGTAIQGRVIGGQQPVTGASIQLYAANASGTSPAGYGAASTPLLTPAVTTVDGGEFDITGLYTCPAPQTQVYIVATGGNPGLNGNVDNTAITLLAALGDCGGLSGSTHIILNEATTVAAVWALAPFMTAFDHVGASGTNATGLRNAFGMANTLAAYSSGLSPGNAPAGSTIPSAEINLLANVLAACVNSPGGSPGDNSNCGNLFLDTTLNGNIPTNTADAALAIARNPSNRVADIFDIASSTGPFQPALAPAPNDYTVAVNFVIGTRTTSGIAFDATGNLWVVSPDALYELGPEGTVLGSYSSMAGNSVALDDSGDIWVTTANNTLAEMPPSLSTPAVYSAPNTPNVGVDGLAIDGFGNAWYTCDTCSAVYELSPSGAYLGTYAEAGVTHSTNISIDPSDQAWLGNYDLAQINVLANNRTPLGNSPLSCGTCGKASFVANDNSGNAWIVGYDLTRLQPGGTFANIESPTGGLYNPAAVAIDGGDNAWVTNTVAYGNPAAGSLSQFSNGGAAISPANGYISDTLATPQSVAVDGSGNVWLRNSGNASVTAFVGAAVPVVTPLALGVKNGSLGSLP